MDTKELAQKLLKDLDEDLIKDIDNETLKRLQKEMNPYSTIAGDQDSFLNCSITDLTQKYMRRLLMTAMIGFLNRACDEWNYPQDLQVVPVYEYVQNPDSDLLAIQPGDTERTKNVKKYNLHWMKRRVIVKEFLEEMFQYDPDIHVRSAYAPNPDNENRKIVLTPAAKIAVWNLSREAKETKDQTVKERLLARIERIKSVQGKECSKECKCPGKSSDQKAKDPECKCSGKSSDQKTNDQKDQNDPKTKSSDQNDPKATDQKDQNDPKATDPKVKNKSKMDQINDFLNETKTEEHFQMIPPQDIFGRFSKYYDENYESLRESVYALYGCTADFEHAVQPISVHSTAKEAEAYKRQHCNEFLCDVYTLGFGKWNLIGPFSQNRQKISFYGDNSHIIKELLDRTESDSKLAADMLKKRVKVKKVQNIIEAGPHPEKVSELQNMHPDSRSIGKVDVKRELKSFRLAQEKPEDGVEVPIFRINRGTIERDFFYTKVDQKTQLLQATMPRELEKK